MKGREYELLLECISKNATTNPKILGRMTTKEKAEELVKYHYDVLKETDTCIYGDGCPNDKACQLGKYIDCWHDFAKKQALITIGQILYHNFWEGDKANNYLEYWTNVMEEVKKL